MALSPVKVDGIDDAQKPATQTALVSHLSLLSQGSLQSILHKVVGTGRILYQCPGVTPQPRNLSGNQPTHVFGQGRLLKRDRPSACNDRPEGAMVPFPLTDRLGPAGSQAKRLMSGSRGRHRTNFRNLEGLWAVALGTSFQTKVRKASMPVLKN